MTMVVNSQRFGAAPSTDWTATLTIGSGEVSSNLTNYPLYVDLADMPSGFWANTNEGKDLRASVSGTQIPVDVVWCSVAEQKGALFLKVPTVASGSSTTIDLEGDGLSDRVANNDTYGRNAVWSDYHAVFMLGESCGDDRTGGAIASVVGDPDFFELIETSSTDLNSHQGICWDGTHYYTTDDNAIYKWNSSWTQVDSNTDPIGDAAVGGSPTVNHCGDPDVHNGLLYIPLECYPASGGLYNAHIVVFDAATLSFVTSYDISAQAHEASSIAYCGRDGLLYVSDFDANFNKLFKYDPSDGSYDGTLTLSHNVTNTQGVTWWRDYFWMSQDANDETMRVDYAGNVTQGNLSGGAGGIGFGTGTAGNYEGIGHRDDGLIQHIDPGTTERAEIWRPRRLSKAAQGGASFAGAAGTAITATGRSSFTVFTLGATINLAAKTANHPIVSYTDATITPGTNTRTTLAYRHANTTLAVWDSANSWMDSSPIVNPSTGTSYRVHAVYNGTTNRKLYVDGVLKNTSGAISNAPTADALFIAADDTDFAETTNGVVGFVYLRNSILSDAWLAAEHSNLNSPSGFYSIV